MCSAQRQSELMLDSLNMKLYENLLDKIRSASNSISCLSGKQYYDVIDFITAKLNPHTTQVCA